MDTNTPPGIKSEQNEKENNLDMYLCEFLFRIFKKKLKPEKVPKDFFI